MGHHRHLVEKVEKQVIGCLATRLALDPDDPRLHVLAQLTTICPTVSGRDWVLSGGQGGRDALLQRLARAYQSVPASFRLSAPA